MKGASEANLGAWLDRIPIVAALLALALQCGPLVFADETRVGGRVGGATSYAAM